MTAAIQPAVQALGELLATVLSVAPIGEKIAAIQADLGALWTSITSLDWRGAWTAFQTWLATMKPGDLFQRIEVRFASSAADDST